jgi:hypothetical protein
MGAGAGRTRALSSRAPERVFVIPPGFSTGLERLPSYQQLFPPLATTCCVMQLLLMCS